MTWQVINGNSATILKTYPDNSFDCVITDPPYGISFLGKAWDHNTGDREVYEQCLRVLKPGGHLLAFSAARTYHHLAMTVETVGFEIRDQIMWLQSNGFPKSTTHLKPQHEPICMAKKKGKGYLNITDTQVNGRYPSNVLGEISEPYQKYFYCPKVSGKERHIGHDKPPAMFGNVKGCYGPDGKRMAEGLDNRGGGNNHPTVKPIELMKYLIKLVTPYNGHILDPFNGSGSTGCAAVELGFDYTGIELDPNYVEIATKRISHWEQECKPKTTYNNLFEEY
jgi:site-specific DNA-methyltransferase (adenine-specific)